MPEALEEAMAIGRTVVTQKTIGTTGQKAVLLGSRRTPALGPDVSVGTNGRKSARMES
jgi:hypothetical protein